MMLPPEQDIYTCSLCRHTYRDDAPPGLADAEAAVLLPAADIAAGLCDVCATCLDALLDWAENHAPHLLRSSP